MFWSHFQQQGLALLISTTLSLFERQGDQIIDTPLDLHVSNKPPLFLGRRFYFEEDVGGFISSMKMLFFPAV